jgi:hypothetical protein
MEWSKAGKGVDLGLSALVMTSNDGVTPSAG